MTENNGSLQGAAQESGESVGYGTNFEGASLRQADATGANFTGANLRNANLCGTNFQDANLTDVDFTGAITDDTTNFDGAILTGAKNVPPQAKKG